MKRLKVTLIRSAVAKTHDQQATVRGLGLRKIGHSRELENTPAIRGMVKKVMHLVHVEDVAEA